MTPIGRDVFKGQALTPIEGGRVASLILRPSPERRASATVGCNRMAGGYQTTEGGGITFGQFASTMMTCRPPLDARERARSGVVAMTRDYAIARSTLVLYDDEREILAVLRSVALR